MADEEQTQAQGEPVETQPLEEMPEQDVSGSEGLQEDMDITGMDPEKLMAGLSYLAILVLVPLFTNRHNPFVLFHAKQGLVILVGYILALVAVQWISIVGTLLFILCAGASLAGFMQAIQGKWWKVPIVGDMANKFRL